jgi:hypothetical protein
MTLTYTLQEVQNILQLNNRQLWKWFNLLKIEPTPNTQDSRKREITYEQFQQLKAALTGPAESASIPNMIDMLSRIEKLESQVKQLQEEIHVLKNRPARASGSSSRASTRVSAGGPTKASMARLAEQHGIKYKTAEGWDWPSDARETLRASLLYIRGRLQSRGLDLQECDDAQCECHAVVNAR